MLGDFRSPPPWRPPREARDVEPRRARHVVRITMQPPRRVEGIRDEAQLEATCAKRLEPRVRGRAEDARRLPGRVLRLEKAPELVVVDRHAEVSEELAD